MKQILIIIALMVAGNTFAAERSTAVTKRFRELNPCPATGKIQRTCPGYVIDHIEPLCAAADDAEFKRLDALKNLQWQDTVTAKEKDKIELQYCACVKRRLVVCRAAKTVATRAR